MGNGPSAGSRIRLLAAPVAAALLLTATGCGGDGAAAPTPRPASTTPSPSESGSPSESPSPSPTPTTKPLSRFEDERVVQVSRRWARLYADSINRGDRSFRALQPLLAPGGLENMRQISGEDFGLYFPGPLPFTPTGVDRGGGEAVVIGCFWLDGFALEEEGGVPANKRQIGAGQVFLERHDGRWKVLTLSSHDHSCSNVPVKGIGW